ncbi:SLOG family protein [uncultured Alistipes sp.]|uniref:SLOG family protein n=1 Tax=uncultured Alistipes sp. TaxID=538949 RepID=UPI00266EAF70|nr:SLOG family protein [uncultured Alistipes sp.]
MNPNPATAVAFTGHRTYCGEAAAALQRAVETLYAEGCRTFLSGMAAGFDMAAAETVLACRDRLPGLRLVAVVPFEGHINRFSNSDRERFGRIVAAADETTVLSARYHRGVYMQRNDYLVSHAARLVAWFDGSPGGTFYTLCRALQAGRRIDNLCPAGPGFPPPMPTLF